MSSIEEQFHMMQQQIAALQEQLNGASTMQSANDTAPMPLHSMTHLEYKAPATIHTAERLMTKGQRYEDRSLKHLQYLSSAAFRLLDILSHELVSSESDNSNLERYCTMLRDVPRKTTLEVTVNRRQPRRFTSSKSVSSSSFSNVPDQQFFRSGPPSQQGGYINNSHDNNFSNNNSSNFNSNNNFRQNNNKKKNTNPFRP
ncbi:hypothetical protein G6F57_006024 [Rhizopus arrhizus]|uniref:Uncharacterized protein n=1 Tax=Rhizopus oryzae TaxID=64495 RepID=A0A9P7BV19_RHIOR|nr:hypothetical protein G6F30_010066 [Rhizopus arrhizus]KAG1421017.1 hypothetical protein G6F58_003933 [Rhizopus delemar]KAG0980836.1 hypothetical protein G6F29_007528 [Rhizopus arrhizus]KAG0993267.1 hypothetical protein G6F28_006858 [Rhizopus arrhizus]KAG1014205.1 hypothetical protein G6F27_001193 [Rhizopus arrhizus]